MSWWWYYERRTRLAGVRVSSTSKSTIVFFMGRWESGGYTATAAAMLAASLRERCVVCGSWPRTFSYYEVSSPCLANWSIRIGGQLFDSEFAKEMD